MTKLVVHAEKEARKAILKRDQPHEFWKYKQLHEMTTQEWESLCDGCAKCCLEKVFVEEESKLYLTSVSCRLLDIDQCQCSSYDNRFSLEPECIKLTPNLVPQLTWLPETCAYRRVYLGLDLLDWHPLVSGNPLSPHQAQESAQKIALHPVQAEGDLQDYIIEDLGPYAFKD